MNAAETGKLLGFMAMYDNRRVDELVIVAWHRVLGDLRYADAEAAVAAHYTETTERIMPAHVRQRVKALRDERIRRTEIPAPPRELLNDPDAYRKALRESAKRIADGEEPPRALEA